ncbi:hypothetical protein [Coleofasciculus sp. FACHB-712]|nr:hypothetical protein [Coleofasciculus sp. FACHB-712]
MNKLTAIALAVIAIAFSCRFSNRRNCSRLLPCFSGGMEDAKRVN